MKFLLGLTFLVFVAFPFSSSAKQIPCLPITIKEWGARLEEHLKMKEFFKGVDDDGGLIVMYSNGNAWTVLWEFPDGPTCILSAGETGEIIPFGTDS